MNGEPRASSRKLVELWADHRDTAPVVVVRCRTEPNCGKELGRVWATRDGLLLHYVSHVAPRRMAVDASAVPDEQLREHLDSGRSGLKRYDPGAETGIGTGLRDEQGWLAMLDDDDYWHPATAGCMAHVGMIELDRQQLLDLALEAVRRDRPKDLDVTAG